MCVFQGDGSMGCGCGRPLSWRRRMESGSKGGPSRLGAKPQGNIRGPSKRKRGFARGNTHFFFLCLYLIVVVWLKSGLTGTASSFSCCSPRW